MKRGERETDALRDVTPELLLRVAALDRPPLVSIHLPFDPTRPAHHDEKLYRGAVREAVERLERVAGAEAARAREPRLAGLKLERRILGPATRALAIFCDGARLLACRSHLGLAAPSVGVGATPMLRPLLRAAARNRPYRVLAFSPRRVALFEGDAFGLRAVPLPDVPHTLEEALGSELEVRGLQVHSGGGGGGDPIYHGQGGAKDERSRDRRRFQGVVAEALRKHLPDDGRPLVLAADQVHQGALRSPTALPALLEAGLVRNPDALAAVELHALAWPLVGAALEQAEAAASGDFERARARGKASVGLDDVVRDILAGRVRRLWIQEDARLPGRLSEAASQIVECEGDDDALDALARAVLVRGGEVRVLSSPQMPGPGGVAAELH